uniref:Uncharacterized protein n=1 Tax=Monopterus albus TaxID=43700 RepID=A0A3Q3JWT1_MONAL
MDLNRVNHSPTEEGELEDGEICDDENEESVPIRKGEGNRHGRAAPSRTRKPHPFWERSHGTLGRFRHRAMPNAGRGAWCRGSRGEGGSRPPLGRYGPGESHGSLKESPSRKPKFQGRNQTRKVAHSVSKPENSVDESFEDLLSKYKQIQLELECIRKEETRALEPKASPFREEPPDNATSELEKAEKKVFHAFNIKPLRQKLPAPANLDELQKKWAEQEKEGDAEKQGEIIRPFMSHTL